MVQVMPPAEMGELEFQQRWEYRRRDNDFDSSCDDSKSSSEPLRKKHKLVSSLISVGDHETSGLKQKDNDNPGTGDQINVGKAKKRKARNISNNLQNSKRKRDSPKEVDLPEGETSAYDPVPLDDVKNFMESLLEDLKVTRENLLKLLMEEMQKLVADDTTPEPKRRKRGHRGKKVQLQPTKKSKKVQDQHGKTAKESMQVQHPNNFEESIQVQQHNNFQKTVLAQQQNNFQVNVMQLQEEENINRQHQNDIKYGMRSQNCNNRSLVGLPKSSHAAYSTDCFNALGDGVDSGKVTEVITSSKKSEGDSSSISAKSNLQTSCADQDVQLQSHKSVVLAIEAQKRKGGSLERSVKSKNTVDRSSHFQVPEDQGGHGQAMRTALATEKTNGEMLGSSVVQNFLSSPSGQAPSSMYLTLPTVLTEPIVAPIVANRGLDASLYDYILPRVAMKKRGANSERMNQILEASCTQGSFPVIHPEERIQSFAPMGSRNTGCVNQNSTPTSGIGNGYPLPLHQGIDVGLCIPRQVHAEYLYQDNDKTLALRMNGGAISFAGGTYNLSEHPAANNRHFHSTYQSDSGLMSYQLQNIKDGHLLP
ncbi:uncharacterized protein LOC110424764 isoform X2 [Herrania umbratica]|uniref:Uncharacterized protein LOC110424764 isoform X2 n=1 Tax=Herrania umbratica TaxID=108875 RepID=A0A6J1B7E1_9ROSI|nr:uncharacterized protein LOC110424764 isoform X2 [Herrania umbratica]